MENLVEVVPGAAALPGGPQATVGIDEIGCCIGAATDESIFHRIALTDRHHFGIQRTVGISPPATTVLVQPPHIYKPIAVDTALVLATVIVVAREHLDHPRGGPKISQSVELSGYEVLGIGTGRVFAIGARVP